MAYIVVFKLKLPICQTNINSTWLVFFFIISRTTGLAYDVTPTPINFKQRMNTASLASVCRQLAVRNVRLTTLSSDCVYARQLYVRLALMISKLHPRELRKRCLLSMPTHIYKSCVLRCLVRLTSSIVYADFTHARSDVTQRTFVVNSLQRSMANPVSFTFCMESGTALLCIEC